MTAVHQSTKTYGHEIGLSAAFRQWRADSHCRFIHGYALAVRVVFEAKELDVRNWVVDFGSLKSFKGLLEDTFDHKLLIAEDDPKLREFEAMQAAGLCQLRILPGVGCERFAQYIFEVLEIWLKDNGYAPRVWVREVEVKEHGANSAIYRRVGEQCQGAHDGCQR